MSLKERMDNGETPSTENTNLTDTEIPDTRLKDKVRTRLLQLADQNKFEKGRIEEVVSEIINEMVESESLLIKNREKQRIISETVEDVSGYGPITPLIKDPTITDIMVNGPKHVFIEIGGKIEKSDIVFRDASQLMHVIERIVSPIGRRIDEGSPMVDARLPDGSRVNAIIQPLSLDGPILTIRKFSKDPLTIYDLINFGTLDAQMETFLKQCIEARLNMVICGGTGSGKTTTLNVLSSFIPSDERIVTIEDAAELRLHQEHVVRLETRQANIEGKGIVTVRDLVKNALRMRPDRIVVGEVRSGEALDMLQAMNTGHDGSMTTGHANSPRDMLARLETMSMMAGIDIPLKAIRQQIASAIDLIIHQVRFKDGSRKIVNITEVQGMEGDTITLQDIFIFKPMGKDQSGEITGKFNYTGFKPKFIEKFGDTGMRVYGRPSV